MSWWLVLLIVWGCVLVVGLVGWMLRVEYDQRRAS
jgi:hypothetical protein